MAASKGKKTVEQPSTGMKHTMEYWSPDQITPYWNNPRNNAAAVEAVKASIAEYDFLVPIVVDHAGVIITGHTRYKASVELGLTEVPVIKATHLSEAKVRAFRLADNRVAENSTWDESKLAEELRQLADMGFDLGMTGFTKSELDCLCGVIAADCLQDLGYEAVCGAVSAHNVEVTDTVMVSIGLYKFRVSVSDYKQWELAMLNQHASKAEVMKHIISALGFKSAVSVGVVS